MTRKRIKGMSNFLRDGSSEVRVLYLVKEVPTVFAEIKGRTAKSLSKKDDSVYEFIIETNNEISERFKKIMILEKGIYLGQSLSKKGYIIITEKYLTERKHLQFCVANEMPYLDKKLDGRFPYLNRNEISANCLHKLKFSNIQEVHHDHKYYLYITETDLGITFLEVFLD